MTMQTDVKATSLTSSNTVFAGRARVKGLTIAYASGGTVVIKDGGASGTAVYSFTAPAAAGAISVLIPGQGILCTTDIYVALTSATASVFYG